MAQIAIVSKKVNKGLDLPAIADALEMEEESVRPIWEAVKEAAPEYDKDQILRALHVKQ